jgi:FKBP-type peptidyl-prolyl cis-trans isomerase 2
LSNAVSGLRVGDTKTITLSPEKTFGPRDVNLISKYDRDKTVPKIQTLSAQQYTQQFNAFPVKDKTVELNDYIGGRVTEVSEQNVTLALFPKEDKFESELGTTQVKTTDENFIFRLTPQIGSLFRLDKKTGMIVSMDEDSFTVDYNHPLAGKNIVLDVKVVSLTKASGFKGKELNWIEDFDAGLAAAKTQSKPAVLVLYADWCKFCKKLFNTTLQDPRIKMMKDDFVWVKINSAKQKEYKALYGQKGFPMTVLLDTHGEVIESIKGFRPANEFQAELKKALNKSGADPKLKARHQMKKGV